jgi:hypothetical protein
LWLEVDCAADLPLMRGDRTMVEQVLLNLVVNARDAMPGGGRLSLADLVVVHDPADPVPARVPRPVPGTFVRAERFGHGHRRSRRNTWPAFSKPFFTTEAGGQGHRASVWRRFTAS